MASRVSPFLLHVGAAGVMVWGFQALQSLPITAFLSSQYGGHFQFLTIQGLFVSIFAMVVAALADIFPRVYGLRTLKRALLMLAMPLEAVVACVYWPLMMFLPYAILRAEAAGNSEPTFSNQMIKLARIPLSVDLALHAVPAASLLLDFIIFEKKYSKSAQSYAMPLVGACALFYSSWAEYCGSINGNFPYPFLTDNPFGIRVVIYAGASSIAYWSFHLVNRFHV
ncbi:FAR-17a/AIG1-like protein [Mucidula mucida]|nr:FAR-17a/AIG1-like protein [Mucidula mucida]